MLFDAFFEKCRFIISAIFPIFAENIISVKLNDTPPYVRIYKHLGMTATYGRKDLGMTSKNKLPAR